MSSPVAGTTEHTAPANRVYFPALDGIRAAAFLLVFFVHYIGLPWGWSGVNIFFVLSGFLITGILIDTRDAPHRIRNFYIRRTLRIFPLYYGIFLLLLLITPLAHWQWTRGWWAWPFYLGNFLRFVAPGPPNSIQQYAADAQLHGAGLLYLGHFWSLCVEEQFYLVWPAIVFGLVFRIRSLRTLVWICTFTVVVVPLLRVFVSHHAPDWMLDAELLYRFTPFQLDSLLLGGLLALLWRGAHRARLIAIARVVAVVCTIATVVYMTITLHGIAPSRFFEYDYPDWKFTWGLTFINLFAGSLIVCAMTPGSVAYRLFDHPALRWIGRISYGAYVFHDICHTSYVEIVVFLYARFPTLWLQPKLVLVLIALPATLLLAWLSYRFFESPFLRLKERWAR
jgi:peptidoglycan/LPS O-acetylase OafA/YrhL